MTEKGLNLFNNLPAECVAISVPFRKKSVPLLPGAQSNIHFWHHSKLIKMQDTNQNKQKWCCSQSKYFTGTRDTVRHLKTFRVISNQIPVLLFILC